MRFSHLENTLATMDVTFLGILILVRLEHTENAEFPKLVIPSGSVMSVRFVHQENTFSPMLVTVSGIVTLVRPVQPENALSGIASVQGNSILLSLHVGPAVFRPSQLLNAVYPISVIPDGIMTLVRYLQS